MRTYKLGWSTDTHFNFVDKEGLKQYLSSVAEAKLDGLLLTGDIAEADDFLKFINLITDSLNIRVFYVLGNHDYYKGSIVELRNTLQSYYNSPKNQSVKSHYLSQLGGVGLDKSTYLVGHDGWYDGNCGMPLSGKVEIYDQTAIKEFRVIKSKNKSKNDLEEVFSFSRKLAQESVDHIKQSLTDTILKTYKNIVIATHVSPFWENSVYRGRMSDLHWAPYFVNQQLGEYIRQIATSHQDNKFLVLCGHSHGSARNQFLPNLVCITGEAEYRFPKLQGVVDSDGLSILWV